MIPPETVASIHSAARVEEVVREYVNLKKRGANLIGLCPFHNEKTPSFNVSPTKGIYKCFGCGKAGNAVKFVMEHEKLSYPEALRLLARKYNITIEEIDNAEAREAKNLLDSLYLVNQFAQEHFTQNLWENAEGVSIGMSYFKERGYREDIIKKFQLGYSLKAGSALTNLALSKQYNKEFLLKLGLTKENERGAYDFYRARVMFPIHNLSGKVIAFGGRTLSTDKKQPKYINSPESEIYNKSKVLYGIYQAKNSIRNTDNCFLVEGYTDVVSLNQAGIENVVASSGTSLTKEQILLIKRFTENITVLYDGDKAGINAALRGTDMILEADMNVRVVLLPDGEDPDSFVQKSGQQQFLDFVSENAKDFVLFKTNLLVEQTQNDPIKKAQLIHSIVDTLGKIPDPIKRTVYIQQVAGMMDLKEQVLVNEINKIRYRSFNDFVKNENTRKAADTIAAPEIKEVPKASSPTLSLEDSIELVELELVACLLHIGDKEIDDNQLVGVYALQMLAASGVVLKHPVCKKMVDAYQEGLAKGLLRKNEYFEQHFDNEIATLYAELMAQQIDISPNWGKHGVWLDGIKHARKTQAEDLVNRLKIKHVQLMIEENLNNLKNANNDTDQLKYMKIDMRLTQMHMELVELLRVNT